MLTGASQCRKPRNARSKRALEKRAPKVVENPKKALFLRYTTCSQLVQDVLADLYALRQPLAKKFTKKNDVRPFDDPQPLEFFSEKNDCSLLLLGSSSKKRPHTVTLARMFGHRLLDMAELHIDAAEFRSLSQFRTAKVPIGLRPLLVFAGSPFDSPLPGSEHELVRSLLTDFFRGEEAPRVDVEGLRYVVCISAEGDAAASSQPQPATASSTGPSSTAASALAGKPPIRIRSYLIHTKRSASSRRLPRVEVEEMGPRLDFRVGRTKHADEATMKEALKTARLPGDERSKKNIETSRMGDKLGRIHLGRQDLGDLQTRKMKGLKRGRADQEEDSDEEERAMGARIAAGKTKKQKNGS